MRATTAFGAPQFVNYGKKRRRVGVCLGMYRDPRSNKLYPIRADNAQPRGILILGPPGTGKSSCYFIPTLLTFPESAFVYDPKFELYYATAGYRRVGMLNKILLFAPTKPDISCSINIFDAVQWGTPYEIADLQGIVKQLLDPSDKAAEGAEAHWIATGAVLGEITWKFLAATEPHNCTLVGAHDYLTDPRWGDDPTKAFDSSLARMTQIPHDPDLRHGYRDDDGNPSPFDPYIVHGARELLAKAPAEKSGVLSTFLRFLQPYRDESLRRLTSTSSFSFDDLLNHETPVTLYFCIPPSEVQRLRVLVRLCMNLIIRAHTGDNALTYDRFGNAKYRFKWTCLLAIDEFAQLGKAEQVQLALSVVRSYGIWPMFGLQSPNQLLDAYGANQSITSMMWYKIFLTQADHASAEWCSKELGQTTTVSTMLSQSGGQGLQGPQVSRSMQLGGEALVRPEALMDLPSGHAFLKVAGIPTIATETHYWESNREWVRRSRSFLAPEVTDAVYASMIPGLHTPPNGVVHDARPASTAPRLDVTPLSPPAESPPPSPADAAGAAVAVAAAAAIVARPAAPADDVDADPASESVPELPPPAPSVNDGAFDAFFALMDDGAPPEPSIGPDDDVVDLSDESEADA